MTTDEIGSQLADFASRLVGQAGGLVEWEANRRAGIVLAPAELAAVLRQPAEAFSVSAEHGRGDFHLGLGGDFVELATKALQQFVPAVGSFAVRDLPIKKSEYQQAVDSSFGWQNARARVRQGEARPIAYHFWWFHVLVQSDDAWESLVPVAVNNESLVVCSLDDVFSTMDLSHAKGRSVIWKNSLPAAARWVEGDSLRQSQPFVRRVEERLERDRQRLREYYQSLYVEAASPNRRLKTAPTAEEIASRQDAVKLELRRKLQELDERYSLRGTLRPVAIAEIMIPGVAIELEIQRKTAVRRAHVYWNGLLRRLEPMPCSLCGVGAFNIWFTNDEVAPVCKACHG